MIERETSNTTDPEYKWELLPDDYTKYDLSFKLIVIGDSGVGKSCLTNKATKNIFEESYNATVGFEFFSFKEDTINGNQSQSVNTGASR